MPEDLDKEYKDELINFYHEFNTNRIDYNTRKWETVKFFSSLHIALITATVAISTIIYKNGSINPDPKPLLYFLPISAIIVLCLGWRNLKHESELLFEQEASMFKIEKYLGLHNNEIPEYKRWLPGDPYLIPQKHRDIFQGAKSLEKKDLKSITTKDWVKARLQEHGFLKSRMKGVFLVEIFIAILLIVIIYRL